MYGAYSKVYDFYDDYINLPIYLFEIRVNSLEGNFGDVLSARYKYLKNEKMDKEERKSARKALNKKQLEFVDKKRDEALIQNVLNSPSKRLEEIIAKRGGGNG